MDWASIVMKGFALLGMLTLVFYVGKIGLKPVMAKIVGSVGTAKADFAALEARVMALEGAIAQVPLGAAALAVSTAPAAPKAA